MTRFSPSAALSVANMMAAYGPAPEDESVFVMFTVAGRDNEIPGELLEIGDSGTFRVWAFASPYEVDQLITSIREIV